jgi:predicted Zn-dependent protease
VTAAAAVVEAAALMAVFAALCLNVITTVLIAVGGGVGVVAFLKYPRENDRVIVSAAEGLHTIQSGVIDALQEELTRIRALRDAAETDRDRCRDRINELEGEVDTLKGELRALRQP